jgi:hypothetical protein
MRVGKSLTEKEFIRIHHEASVRRTISYTLPLAMRVVFSMHS